MPTIAKGKRVSAIIPVYNEEKTIAGAIDILSRSKMIDEIICVNDCSTDKSLSILRSLGNKITLVLLPRNYGKGYALVAGIKRAKGELVMFIDGDLINFSDTHIQALLNPIEKSKTIRAVIGYPIANSKKIWHFSGLLSSLSGERVYYKKDLLPHLKYLAKTRFGAEIYLNQLFTKDKTVKVPLKNLDMLLKHEKFRMQQALKEWAKEFAEITQEVGKREGILPKNYDSIIRFVTNPSLKSIKGKLTNYLNGQF